MEHQPEIPKESMDARARRLSEVCGAVIRLSGTSTPAVGSLRTFDSSYINALSHEMEVDSMAHSPEVYASILEIIKSPRPTYEDLRADSSKRREDMEKYRDFIENKDQRKIAIRNDDVRS